MLESQTAVLERNTTFTEDFQTEPFEAAWAREARWFVTVLEHDGAPVSFTTQISPDGLTWVDLDQEQHTVDSADVVSWSTRDFGHWLRIRASLTGTGTSLKVRIYLALKS